MQKETQSWTVITLLQRTVSYLQEKLFENPRLETEHLLARALHLRRIDLYLQFDRPLTNEEVNLFRTLLQRRLAHEPLQYITGETEFMALPFYVGKGVLIPRPETEILVENAFSIGRTIFNSTGDFNILDIGTGSGNIAVSIAKNIPHSKIVAIDHSSSALAYAEKNAARHSVSAQVQFMAHDIRSAVPDQWYHRFQLILSNPPYIRTQDYHTLADEIVKYEPPEALLGGEDGLDYYRVLSRQVPLLLQPGGYALLEIGADMASAVMEIFHQSCFDQTKVIPDLAGRDRIISFCFREEKTP
ncbi:peptide chain release factor N(5)-glutamine methyltransferase [candidate division KSB1 bacterium]|nr:peptide chain release factor N(5)-glutamine methyltransferase [candidate division KSB1 bacterium]